MIHVRPLYGKVSFGASCAIGDRDDALREALLVARNVIDALSAKGVAYEGRIEVRDDAGELVLSFKIQALTPRRDPSV
jgi:hypothetical protein